MKTTILQIVSRYVIDRIAIAIAATSDRSVVDRHIHPYVDASNLEPVKNLQN